MWAGSVWWEGAKTHILKIFAILRVSPSQQPGPGHPFTECLLPPLLPAALSGTGAGHKRPDVGAKGGSYQVTLSPCGEDAGLPSLWAFKMEQLCLWLLWEMWISVCSVCTCVTEDPFPAFGRSGPHLSNYGPLSLLSAGVCVPRHDRPAGG